MRPLALHANDGDGKCIGPKRETLDAPAQHEQREPQAGDERCGRRLRMPPEHVHAGDDRQAEETCRQHAEQERPVSPGLLRVERQTGALAQELGIDAVYRKRAGDANEQHHSEQHPCLSPGDRTRRGEQQDCDEGGVRDEPRHYPKHRCRAPCSRPYERGSHRAVHGHGKLHPRSDEVA